MNSRIRDSQPDFRRLYSAYQEAWSRFRTEVGIWQSLVSEPADQSAIQQAQNRVARAEASYRLERNKFADYLIGRSVHPHIAEALLSSAHLAGNTNIIRVDSG